MVNVGKYTNPMDPMGNWSTATNVGLQSLKLNESKSKAEMC